LLKQDAVLHVPNTRTDLATGHLMAQQALNICKMKRTTVKINAYSPSSGLNRGESERPAIVQWKQPLVHKNTSPSSTNGFFFLFPKLLLRRNDVTDRIPYYSAHWNPLLTYDARKAIFSQENLSPVHYGQGANINR